MQQPPTIENTLNAVREFFKAPWDNIFKSIREGFINVIVAIFKPIVNIFKNGFGFDLKNLFGSTETKPIHKDKTSVADLPKKKEASSKNVKVDINVNDPGKIIKSISQTQEGKAHYILSNGGKLMAGIFGNVPVQVSKINEVQSAGLTILDYLFQKNAIILNDLLTIMSGGSNLNALGGLGVNLPLPLLGFEFKTPHEVELLKYSYSEYPYVSKTLITNAYMREKYCCISCRL